jgi:S1-C subfamily serine protease
MVPGVTKRTMIAAGVFTTLLSIGMLAILMMRPAKKGPPHAGGPHTGPLGVEIGRDRRTGKPVLVDIAPGGAAYRAGLKKGDILIKIADVPIDEPPTAVRIVRQYQSGDKVTLRIKRVGIEKDVSVVLTAATP